MGASATPSTSRDALGSGDDLPRSATRATVRDVDRAIDELRRRRSEARLASRQRVTNSTSDAASSPTPASPDELDQELAAMDAEVEAAMGKLKGDAPVPEAKQRQKENVKVLLEKTNKTNHVTSATERRRPIDRRTGARSTHHQGPTLGAGVFGALECSAAEVRAEAAAARAEAKYPYGFASRKNADDEGDEMSRALSSWTRDVDAVLSKLDACDEVVNAKQVYFKEKQQKEKR